MNVLLPHTSWDYKWCDLVLTLLTKHLDSVMHYYSCSQFDWQTAVSKNENKANNRYLTAGVPPHISDTVKLHSSISIHTICDLSYTQSVLYITLNFRIPLIFHLSLLWCSIYLAAHVTKESSFWRSLVSDNENNPGLAGPNIVMNRPNLYWLTLTGISCKMFSHSLLFW
jgi:hypothetical protein